MTMIERRPSPFDEMMSLRKAVARLFEDSFARPFARIATNTAESVVPLDEGTDADDRHEPVAVG